MATRSEKKNALGGDISRPAPRKMVSASPLPLWLNRDWLWGLILILAVILTYTPVWWAGFIWDDDINITANPCIIGPLGLKEIWATKSGQFFPLVLTTFWMEHELAGTVRRTERGRPVGRRHAADEIGVRSHRGVLERGGDPARVGD
jgi:hypothetical protein